MPGEHSFCSLSTEGLALTIFGDSSWRVALDDGRYCEEERAVLCTNQANDIQNSAAAKGRQVSKDEYDLHGI